MIQASIHKIDQGTALASKDSNKTWVAKMSLNKKKTSP